MDDRIWWVVVRRDNGYPVLVYAEEARAELVAKENEYDAVAVRPVGEDD